MKVVLTIAGSDSSGGAGIQADLKTFEAFGVFGASAITVLTAQNTTGVRDIVPMTSAFVVEQIAMVFNDFDVAAIKIGMLFNAEIIHAVRELIVELRIPVILDPVAVSKAGSPLLDDDAVEAMKRLFEHVTLITPNSYEASLFFGYRHDDPASLEMIYNLNTHVLIKDRIKAYEEGVESVDQLFFRKERQLFSSPLVDTTNLHGTGCSFSSAIAANMALGHTLDASIRIAKSFIVEALRNAPSIGQGPGPINHKAGGQHVVLA